MTLGTDRCVARVGPTTPTRAGRLFDASVDHTDARNSRLMNVAQEGTDRSGGMPALWRGSPRPRIRARVSGAIPTGRQQADGEAHAGLMELIVPQMNRGGGFTASARLGRDEGFGNR